MPTFPATFCGAPRLAGETLATLRLLFLKVPLLPPTAGPRHWLPPTLALPWAGSVHILASMSLAWEAFPDHPI